MPLPPDGGGGGGSSPPSLIVSPAGPYAFGNVAVGGTSTIILTVSNAGDLAMTVNSITIGGVPYSLTGLPVFPKLLGAGGSFTFNLVFHPTVVGTFNDTLTVTCASGTDGSPYTAAISGTAPGGSAIGYSPASPISFPDERVGVTSPTQVVTLTNSGNAALTLNSIALAGGTNFILSALPAMPVVMNPLDQKTFNVAFKPLSVGALTDTINVTTTANSPAIVVQGNGVQIIPIAIIANNIKKILMGFQTAAGVAALKMLTPGDLNGAQAGVLIFNGSLWDQPGQEKKLRRVEVFYENVGVGQITLTTSVFRPQLGANSFDTQSVTVSLGTALADLTERTEFADIQTAGELIKLTVSRAAGSGPLSLIGFLPHFEEAGEKVEGR